ncbi:TonB-dependent receptor [Agriterribacter sp.]|uniref:SusC/RagA family TonB-linked outer membrane protein n=1 Tax=Agriterribacter sp. TaxID=2821509 RepID=UPI002C0EB24D|nr:TonB-dependent receptor [Agriterribacter sp.]HRP56450.1 TonB-dependent receptor [Agriterribacter sp.]
MKMVILFTCVLSMQSFARTGMAQGNITIKLENLSLKKAFKTIEKQTAYHFLYNDGILPLQPKVNIAVKDMPAMELMEKLLENTRLTFKIIASDLIVISDPNNDAEPVLALVTGRVVDADNQPIARVSVVEKGTTNGTVTSEDGSFSLNVINDNAVLVISYVGFLTQEIAVNGRSNIEVHLQGDTKDLTDVVVIGYGTSKRKDFTGAVSSVKMENSPLALMPNLNVLEALKGTVTGLNVGAVNSAGGQPSIQIRGQRSISGSNDPLILLDGVIFLGSLSDINPNDIASYDVLKDAVSAAAYGSRSANGIIAINTKKGKTGKPIIAFRTEAGIQKWQNRPVMLKGAEWIDVVNARNQYDPGTTSWLKPGELANLNADKETVWLDEVIQTGITQNYQASISGAAQNVNYYLSSSFDKNRGLVVGDKFSHVSVMGKVNTKVTSWFELGLDGSYSQRDYSGVAASVSGAELVSPYGVMFRDAEGNLEKYPYTQSQVNPLWGVHDGTVKDLDVYNNFRLNAYAVVKVPFIKGLSYRANLLSNYQRQQSGRFYYETYYIKEGEGIDGRYDPASVQSLLANANGNLNNTGTDSYVLDNIITYDNTFGRHQVTATLVATRDHLKSDTTNATGSNFSANGNTALGIYGLSKADIQKVILNNTERSNVGYLARINYDYDSKYYLTASLRRDGASVFGEDKRYANFGAVGVAWRISGESFLKDLRQLNNLKLKFSWGQNGNQGLSPYATLSQILNGAAGNARYQFSDAQGKVFYGLVQQTLGNPSLGWEKTTAINIGFESAWLMNRLFVDVDYYTSSTTDQIFVRNIPIMTGFATQLASLGEVSNKGVEVTVRTVNIDQKDFNWGSTLTFWKNNNKLVHLYGEDNNGDGKEDDDIANNFFIGKSLEAIYGFQQDGIVQTGDDAYITMTGAAPGAPKYIDLNKDGKIDADDRTVLGYGKENFRLNLSNTLRYKSFELYVMVSGIFGGNDRYMKSNTAAYMTSGTGRFNDNTISKPYWTPDNSSDVYPSAYFSGDSRFLGLQSRQFVRIQDVSLSYTIDAEWMKRSHISSIRLFAAARNLATFTKWVGGDPETGTTVQSNTFPVPSSYSIGANFSF